MTDLVVSPMRNPRDEQESLAITGHVIVKERGSDWLRKRRLEEGYRLSGFNNAVASFGHRHQLSIKSDEVELAAIAPPLRGSPFAETCQPFSFGWIRKRLHNNLRVPDSFIAWVSHRLRDDRK